MELEKIFVIFATFIVISSCGTSIDIGKLHLVPHSNNDLFHTEEDYNDVIKPISNYYQPVLNPSHNHRQKAYFNNDNFARFFKPLFNKPLRNFYYNHLKPIFSPFQIDAGIDVSQHHRFKTKPVVEHIDDDFKYDFRTDTYSFK